MAVECIFCERLATGRVVKALWVGFVVRKEGAATGGRVQIALAEFVGKLKVAERSALRVVGEKKDFVETGGGPANLRLTQGGLVPSPSVAKPQVREQVQFSRGGAAIESLYPNANIFGFGLGVFDEDIPVAVVVEDASVKEFVLGTGAIAFVLFDYL